MQETTQVINKKRHTEWAWLKAPEPALMTQQQAELLASSINALYACKDPRPEWVGLEARPSKGTGQWTVEVYRDGKLEATLENLARQNWPDYLRVV
jgi:hypothetical protein